MQKMILTMVFLAIATSYSYAQIAINENSSDPDPSAMLDITSTNKGILLPRMTTTERENINNPADGLLVFDNETQTFWYFENNRWNEIRNGSESISVDDLTEMADETNLGCPTQLGNIDLGLGPQVVTVVGNYAYIYDNNDDELVIIDISDPSNPTQTSLFEVGRDTDDLIIQGNYLYFRDNNRDSLFVVDISDPNIPTIASKIEVEGALSEGIVLNGNYLYLANSNNTDNLEIINIADPLNPVSEDLSTISSRPDGVALLNNYVYTVSNSGDDLTVFDASTPNTLVEIANIYAGAGPRAITGSGDYIYIADLSEDKVRSYDVSNPSTPIVLDSINLTFGEGRMSIEGDILLVQVDNIGFRVLDISDPTNLAVISTYSQEEPEDAVLFNDHVYLVDEETDDLRIFSLFCDQEITTNTQTGELQSTNTLWYPTGAGIATNNSVAVGNIPLNLESDNQEDSDQAGNGYLISPWVYTSAIQGEVATSTFDDPPTILLGSDNNISDSGEIHFVISGNSVMMVDNNDRVGVGTTNPSYKFQVGESGDGTEARANAWETFSDRRLKRNFQLIDQPLEKLKSLNGYYYYWKADKADQSRQVGVIAQEVEAILPEIVGTDDEGIKSVDYAKITALLIESNKALLERVEALELKLGRVKDRVLDEEASAVGK